jgi:hypothetical protein
MVPVPENHRSILFSILAGIVILLVLACAPVYLVPPVPDMPLQDSGLFSPGKNTACDSPFLPLFTDPEQKLAGTASPAFTQQLFREAVSYDPRLNTAGTQVHMGFWSGRGNHGALVSLLDAINSQSGGEPPQTAIWDEGVTAENQFPSYVTTLREHWYERSAPANGSVIIAGTGYADPHPVTFAQADRIWGQYSQRYTDMAALIRNATGKPVRAWCFVEGARADRVFYTYELPELRRLEKEGAVTVYFAKTRNADWTNPADWIEGTARAPVPVMP